MAQKLRFRFIDRIDLVDKGANQEAHIVLVKRAVEKQDGMMDEPPPLTTGEIVLRQEAMEQLCRLKSALWDSMYSIFEHAPLEDQPDLLLTSVQEFAAFARQAIEQMGSMEKGAPLLTELDTIAKAGRKISAARMKRLKEIMAQLEAIMMEGEDMADKDMEKRLTDLEAEKATLTKRAEEAEAKLVPLTTRVETAETALAKAQEQLDGQDPEAIWKGVSPALRKRVEDAEAVAKAERDARVKQDCIQKAAAFSALIIKADDDWELFREIDAKLEKKHVDRLQQILKAAQEAVRQSALFKEVGRGGADDSSDVETLAKALLEKGEAKTIQQARTKVYEQHPEFYVAYKADEQRRG